MAPVETSPQPVSTTEGGGGQNIIQQRQCKSGTSGERWTIRAL